MSVSQIGYEYVQKEIAATKQLMRDYPLHRSSLEIVLHGWLRVELQLEGKIKEEAEQHGN